MRDLTRRVLDRDLFEYRTFTCEEDSEMIRERLRKLNYDERYYIFTDKAAEKLYSPYSRKDSGHNIWILCEDHRVRELSEVSDMVHAVCASPTKEERKVYFPKEVMMD